MGLIRTIALIVLTISFVVFIALFGRLPVFRLGISRQIRYASLRCVRLTLYFRRTPVAFLHQLLWRHLPNGFIAVDERLTGRRISRSLSRTGNYLMNEKHPLVLVSVVRVLSFVSIDLVNLFFIRLHAILLFSLRFFSSGYKS